EELTPEGVGQAARDWAERSVAGRPWTCVFRTLDTERYGSAAGASELVKRAVEFWAAGGQRPIRESAMAVEQPWRWTGERRPPALPTPELAAWRCLVDRLADRRIVGTFPAPAGITCYILGAAPDAPEGRAGALVAWNNGAPAEDAAIEAYLG